MSDSVISWKWPTVTYRWTEVSDDGDDEFRRQDTLGGQRDTLLEQGTFCGSSDMGVVDCRYWASRSARRALLRGLWRYWLRGMSLVRKAKTVWDCLNGGIVVKDISGLARFPCIYRVRLREHIRENDRLGRRDRVRKAMPNAFPCNFLVTSVFTIAG